MISVYLEKNPIGFFHGCPGGDALDLPILSPEEDQLKQEETENDSDPNKHSSHPTHAITDQLLSRQTIMTTTQRQSLQTL